ncbi:MAG: glycosyltransferase [Gammaproteobacteria bacterium]|nr:glycosyltransferase [Gammaproteobacteria bacterium]MBU1732210.1 glycosyltransferase [Gammaproteobacteria bacterium]MBU1893260.1 glycosyltransferase [Gammaproteobacteria bacterium]
MFNAIKQYLSRLLARVRREGWKQTLRKALTVLHDEGLRGLRLRLATMSNSAADYAEWVRRYDTLDAMQRERISERIAGFANPPLISVLMPCFNPNPEWFREAIESVRGQLYPHWELCIADDASTNPAIRLILEEYNQCDPRIKVIFRKENGHISASSNSALEQVTGKYVALLDHDDLLPEHALFWVADAITWHPDSGVIYSDEDKFDTINGRFGPYFKCDWNHDLFLSQNMVSHLGVYRTSLLREVGGFRIGFEGSQDYDLALRCIERLEPRQIIHIPRVLYHWRVHADSTAQSMEAKPYALLAGQNAIANHLNRCGVAATVELGDPTGYRVRYALPAELPLVSILILAHSRPELLRQCISSIVNRTGYTAYEILIIDSGSDDPAMQLYLENLAGQNNTRVLRDTEQFNSAALNNFAVEHAKGELVCLLADDTEVIKPDWLGELVSIALQPGVGAVGARLWSPDDTLQHGGMILGTRVASYAHKHMPRRYSGYFGRAALIQSLSAITSACLLIRRDIYRSLEGMNDSELKMAFSDVDFCLRLLQAGYRNVWSPYAELSHHESACLRYENAVREQNSFASEVMYMQQRYGPLLLNDPAYNPNLSLDGSFDLAWPPRIQQT